VLKDRQRGGGGRFDRAGHDGEEDRPKMLRDNGAKEIHFRVSAPPWKHPCFYGIDTPDEENLLANQMSVDGIRAWLEVDSLGFISLEGLMRAMPKTLGYCTTCFTGRYPRGTSAAEHEAHGPRLRSSGGRAHSRGRTRPRRVTDSTSGHTPTK
jgi:hypothetical protein